MKLPHILLSILCVIVIASCHQTDQQKADYFELSGRIINPTEGEDIILSTPHSSRDTISVDTEGQFLYRDKNKAASGNYQLYYGDRTIPLYGKRGHHLSIQFDNANPKTPVTFQGERLKPINEYLSKKRTREEKALGNQEELYKLGESDFKSELSALKDKAQEDLSNAKAIPPKFVALEKRNLDYQYIGRSQNYERLHQYYTKDPEFEVSQDFLPDTKDLDYNNEEDYKYSSAYQNLVQNHYTQIAQKKAQKEDSMGLLAMVEEFSKVPDSTIKNGLLTRLNIPAYLSFYKGDVDKLYNTYIKNTDNKQAIDKVKSTYKKLEKTKKGNPSPQFTNYENNAGGTSSLKDFRGKYVYIDVWATWCGPCLAELPYLKKIEEEYKDKNISFISISVDKKADHDKWEKMIQEKGMGGTQLFADNNFKSKFVEDYAINAIPRFILLDPDGNIISANATRPSNDKIRAELDALPNI